MYAIFIHYKLAMFPYLSIKEASSTKEIVEWPNAQPWLFLLPSDQYQILSVAFLFLHSFLYPTSLPAVFFLFHCYHRKPNCFSLRSIRTAPCFRKGYFPSWLAPSIRRCMWYIRRSYASNTTWFTLTSL